MIESAAMEYLAFDSGLTKETESFYLDMVYMTLNIVKK
jgi:hypothetical protein